MSTCPDFQRTASVRFNRWMLQRLPGADSLHVFAALLGASVALHGVLVVLMPTQPVQRVVAAPMGLAFYVAEPVVTPPAPVPPPTRVVRAGASTRRAAPSPAAVAPPPVIAGPTTDSVSDVGTFAVITAETTFGPATNVPTTRPGTPEGTGDGEGEGPPGGADVEAAMLDDVKIPYPLAAQQNEVTGTVRMRVTVDARGVVTAVQVLSGPGYGLDEAARAAMFRFRFKPALKGGVAVGSTLRYSYVFDLE